MAKPTKSRKFGNIALIMAAGSGERFGGETPKQYLDLCGIPVLRYSVETFLSHPKIDAVCVVISASHKNLYLKATEGLDLLPFVIGDKKYRQVSVKNGLESIARFEPKNILIHDAARPLINHKIIDDIISSLSKEKAVIPAIPVNDTIKKISNNKIIETIPRDSLFSVQTPQGFDFETIYSLHKKAGKKTFTDDAAIAEAAKIKVVKVPGSDTNFKITTEEDLLKAEMIIKSENEIKIGLGIDAHAFGRKMPHGHHIMLCGIPVVFERELIGHSDGDVGLHSIVDAILGAIGEGDIGEHFPPSDSRWKGANSALFVEYTNKLLKKRRGQILHIDVTMIGEAPKISPHRDAMRERVANLLNIPVTRVSVKATTTDGLGSLGRGEGIAANTIATISLRK